MQVVQDLRGGDVRGALSQLQDQVRANPAKAEYRVFLFQLLAVMGEWGRALTQLEVAGELDAGTLAMVQTYREALRCEVLRSEVFQGKRSPLVFGDPENWIALVIQSLQASAEGKHAQAQDMRQEAYESAEVSTGTIDGKPFEWIADADPRIGPFVEVVLNGSYYWVPFQRIQRIQLDPPEDLRDMVWTPAQFTWSNGGQAVGLIPTRYPGSESSEDSAILLAHKTEWEQVAENEYIGTGQRMLATDADEYPLLDVRDIVLNNKDSSTADVNWTEAAAKEQQE
ncbi:MAG TPA: virulence protein SciE type [Gammaproteobacteria bacterium]|nr:virulence protein SciE type [Gammaproteobacteria bacterium]